jgi:hypothetical protein
MALACFKNSYSHSPLPMLLLLLFIYEFYIFISFPANVQSLARSLYVHHPNRAHTS